MRTRGDKRTSRKHDHKVLVAEESTKNWADTDSESCPAAPHRAIVNRRRFTVSWLTRHLTTRYSTSLTLNLHEKTLSLHLMTWSSSSSSSDSEQEEVHCLMADQTSDDEVFDFSNIEFTREDLVTALNDMVKEYRKLSHSFEEVKAENTDLKNSSVEPSNVELGEADSLKIELSKLKNENEMLKHESSELKAEVERLTNEMSSWNQSSRSLRKLQESQKPANDRTGLGFNSDASSDGETSTQSQPVYDKFNKMSFVKASVTYDYCESMTYNDQNSSKLNQKGKAGIGFSKPESSKPSWLKNKLDKEKAKASSKSFVPNQQWRSSKKVKTGSKRTQPRRDQNDQSMKSQLKRSHRNYAQTLTDSTGKTVKASFTLLPTTMASSLISSSHHIDFDSFFGIDDAGMVQMFESLIATGLKEFLGCPAVFYEDALTEFFANGSVRDGVVVSTIGAIAVEISEAVFAATFELPAEGLTDLSEVPKNLVVDARSLFSESKEQVGISCLKKELKIVYRLLSDILAKTIFVKAGSFDAVTRDRFLLMTAITYDVKVNWSTLLFGILKDMVTPGSRQAKGFAIQICVILKNIPGLELGESRSFPVSRILTEKTVHRYVTINEKVGMEETADSPKLKKTPELRRLVSQKRPAVDTAVAPVVKKKRTTKGKPVAVATVVVSLEGVPLQTIEDTTDAPTEQLPVPKRKTQKRKRKLVLGSDDESIVHEPVVGGTTAEQPAAEAATGVPDTEVEKADEQGAETAHNSIDEGTIIGNVASIDDPESSEKEPVDEPVAGQPEVVPVVEATTDDPDTIIAQVLDQLDSVATTDGGDQPDATGAEERHLFDLPYEDLMARIFRPRANKQNIIIQN
ncbi:hypothetical protein F511_40338 [Dorcoceras hygrometricum]|uniref:Dystroglycan-like n=1 Tax=Dorcoceras hygrometricum TaxID=472368 RepID=A0A2Z7CSY2_9LAMI|nr:hypothetical protein F511_40338 [Dorcoceras hygrometricum]